MSSGSKIYTTLFTNKSLQQTIVKNTFWLLSADVFLKGITALSLLYLAYLLGTHGFGIYSFITSYVGFFILLVDYGLIQYTIRTYAKQSYSKEQLIYHTMILKICGAGLVLTILFIVSDFLIVARGYLYEIILCMIYLIYNSFAEYLRALYRLDESMEKEAILKMMYGVIYALGIGGYALWGNDITILFLILMAVSIINLILTGISIKKIFPLSSLSFSREIFSHIAKGATPFAISAVLISVYMNADQVLLGFYGQHTSLGIYAFAYKITLIFTTVTAAFFSAIFPHSTKYLTTENVRTYFFAGRKRIIYRNSIIIGFLMLLTYAGQHWYTDLLGEYTAVRGILYILWLYCLLEPLGYRGYTNLVSIGKERTNMLFLAIAACINIIANIIFIPKYGYRGAAWTTVGSYLCYTLFCFFYLMGYYPQSVKK